MTRKKTTKSGHRRPRMTVTSATHVTISDMSGNCCSEEEYQEYGEPWVDRFPRLMMLFTPPELARRGMVLQRLGFTPGDIGPLDARRVANLVADATIAAKGGNFQHLEELQLALDMLGRAHTEVEK